MIDQTKFTVPGVSFARLDSGLEIIRIANAFATAQITTNGAHILEYTPVGEKNLLWVSKKSYMEPGKPVRGGVPVCWPWFGAGAKPEYPGHGFVRTAVWELTEVTALGTGATRIVLTLDSARGEFPMSSFPFTVNMIFTVGAALEMTLLMVNRGTEAVQIGCALHTYFAVSDSRKIAIAGLDGTPFRNHVPGAPRFEGNVQHGDIRIDAEFDNVYVPTSSTVEIVDPGWGRVVNIEKSGSLTTVVWNPWIDKSKRMPDFGDEEYPEMVCVECANAAADLRLLSPGVPHVITQKIALR